MPHEIDITRLLNDVTRHDSGAVDRVLPLVYNELRMLARSILSGERPDHTLQSTALVHEAYMRLIDQNKTDWRNRAHFFALASMAIRRILVDHARRKASGKRGGDLERVELETPEIAIEPPHENLLDLDRALAELARTSPERADVVVLRYFAGLSLEEAAEVLEVSVPTVSRRWSYARAWLRRKLDNGAVDAGDGEGP